MGDEEPKEDLEIILDNGERQCKNWECPEFRVVEPLYHCIAKYDSPQEICEECDGFNFACVEYSNKYKK